jgi:LysM repeat protein
MDNNDSNMKPQQTGGLKLMTVFIAVLALHVLVIGGFTVYHLMSGGSSDADLTSIDKSHKTLKSTDGATSGDAATADSTQGDKTTSSAPAPSADVAAGVSPANQPASTPDTTTATSTPASSPVPAVAPAPAPNVTTPKPTPQAPPTEVANVQTPSEPPIAPELVPPVEPNLTPAPSPIAPMVAPSAPVTPLASGPVHMPPAVASTPVREHEHEQIYTVKITDSYKKIAKAHHVTVAELKEANHIHGDVLHTGQKLIIPSGKTFVAGTTPTTSLDAAPATPVLNESVTPVTTSLEAATPSHGHIYTIVKGDTLTKIAHKFKTTPSALMSENNITDPTKLSIGKKLKIPSSMESRSAKNVVPSPSQPDQVQVKQGAATGQLANFVP